MGVNLFQYKTVCQRKENRNNLSHRKIPSNPSSQTTR